MKNKYLIPVFGIFLIFSCNMDEDLFQVIPETDIMALEGMNNAYQTALIYNDSLAFCATEPISCDSTTMFHYDEFFHQFDEMFSFHHGNYSHNNVSDDHHHEGGYNIRHGWMMHPDEKGEHTEGGGEPKYDHSMVTFKMMMDLREMHLGVHPD